MLHIYGMYFTCLSGKQPKAQHLIREAPSGWQTFCLGVNRGQPEQQHIWRSRQNIFFIKTKLCSSIIIRQYCTVQIKLPLLKHLAAMIYKLAVFSCRHHKERWLVQSYSILWEVLKIGLGHFRLEMSTFQLPCKISIYSSQTKTQLIQKILRNTLTFMFHGWWHSLCIRKRQYRCCVINLILIM